MQSESTGLERLVEYGLLDALADGLVVCDVRGDIRWANQRFEELSGYLAADLVGRPVETLISQASRTRHEENRDNFARSGFPTRPMGMDLDIQLLTRTGKTVPADIALSSLEYEGDTFVVACVRDASERIRQERSIRAMREVTESILRGASPDDLYALICDQAVDLMPASIALIALRAGTKFEVVAASVRTGEPIASTTLGGDVWDSLVGAPHRAIIESAGRRNLQLEIGHEIGPAVVFPLLEGQRHGFLLIADEPGRPDFDVASLDRVQTFASQAGLAFAYGRRLRALAVAGDRERIARDLHDLIIQRLFGAGLSLQVAAQTIPHDAELVTRLLEVIGELDNTIAELRRSIFDLERKDRLGLRDRVLITIEEAASDHEIATQVEVNDQIESVPADRVDHLLATLREALSNTGRHASASRVEVIVQVDSELILTVRDDGVGLGRDVSKGHGLSNMSERARQLGGQMELSNVHGGGLELVWRVPSAIPTK